MSSSGEQLVQAFDRMATEREAALRPFEQTATQFVCAMVVSSVQAGAMPPRDIFEWYAMYMLEVLCQAELLAMEAEEDHSDWLDPILERTSASISETLRICQANKLLVLEDKIKKRLLDRTLRLPPAFDASYGGMLPDRA